MTGSLSFEMAKGLPAAVVALVIGLIAAGIAYRQWRVAQAKLKLDLFNKRYEIFETVWRELSRPIVGPPLEASNVNLTNLLPQAEFLFGREIRTYMSDISSRLTRLWLLQTQVQSREATQSEKEERLELYAWFEKEAKEGVRTKFSKYMSFENWH
jgi:hypothetical protein